MDRFIVGTGRCGSTLLSRMLAESPEVLSVFEFFNGLDAGRRFAAEPLPGRDFAGLICAPQPVLRAVLRRGYAVAEVTYPFGSGARYRREDAMPWILTSMLPRLAEDPDRLLDEVVAFASAQPARSFPEHARGLFEWLQARGGHRLWIERSGSSVEYLPALQAAFPDARFVHLHRAGPEVALSMREHHAYRLPISLLYQAPVAGGATPAQLDPIDWEAAPRTEDPVSRILASRPPAAYFGRYWNDQIERGAPALAELATREPPRILDLRFEELVAQPRAVLARIAEFFCIETPETGRSGGWLERAAALVRGQPAARLASLSEAEQIALRESCRSGQKILGRPG